MAYYLAIKENNGYKKLDISNMSRFERLSKFKGSSLSLEETDMFTANYANEKELKSDLYDSRVISFDEIDKELSIRMSTKGKLEKVMYEPIYKDRFKYLDIYYLRSVILSLKKDRKFLEKLVVRYRNSYINNHIINQIRNILNGVSYNNIDSLLNQFYENEIIKKDETTGEIKIKYKSLHDLAMFVHNYIQNKKMEKERITKADKKSSQKEDLLLLKKEIIEYNEREIEVRRKYEEECIKAAEEAMIEDYINEVKSIPKIRKKEKKEVEGQTSLFDTK